MGDGFAVLGERSVAEHTEWVQRQIRASPQNASLRLALCHFLALRGEWQRAEDQLKLAAKIDPSFAPASATCAMALAGERNRTEFWNGGRAPSVVAGQAAWVDGLIAAAAMPPEQADEAAALREAARQDAPASQGTLSVVDRSDSRAVQAIDGEPAETIGFAWLCDGDVRMGAVLELLTPSGYAWLPLHAVSRLKFKRPQHLVDLLWAPAEIVLRDGRGLNGLVPVRYPGKLDALDDETTLGRRTDWLPLAGEEQYAGVGQRTLISEAGDHSLLDVRLVEFDSAATAEGAAP
ncbi:type VI secretion system protein ImpE [Variovorax boronicumulans]|uniref:type VI secretion system accessory protein TagJ n=1 Tax=Variovorax TaxID=34072 RepID=UPI002789BE64|nr:MULTISPECIES: type VI secretion system accessory protein TagJ [Variovorax]MDQ0036114.1 type VI secretion system protein ImpE [Variovorax boronicumulans]MDQ0608340.1 type VI secretion system protein ImpE [Variovorax sp. W1I1]